MKYRNKTNSTLNEVSRTGTLIEFQLQAGDPALFDDSLNLRLVDNSELSGSSSNLTPIPGFGFSFTGSGLGTAYYGAAGIYRDTVNPFDLEMIVSFKLPDTITGTAPYLEFELEGALPYFTIQMQNNGLLITTMEGNVFEYVDSSTRTFNAKLRIVRNRDLLIWQGLWINDKEFLIQTEPFLDESIINGGVIFNFQGTSTLAGNGEIKINSLKMMPLIDSDSWVDASPTRLPLCLSYSSSKALFLMSPISPGTHAPTTLYGSIPSLGLTLEGPTLEAIYDDSQRDNFKLMLSQISKLESDEVRPAICPIEADIIESRSDTVIYNRCFDDNHPTERDLEELTILTSSSGDFKDANNVPKLVMEVDGKRYGRDLDIQSLHPFPLDISDSDLPGLQIQAPTQASPSIGQYAVTRTKVLSNNSRLTYGMISPKINYGLALPEIRITIDILSFDYARVGDAPAAGTRFTVRLFRLGRYPVRIWADTAVLTPYSTTERILALPGAYRIELLPTLPLDADLCKFNGTVTIEMLRPGAGTYETIGFYRLRDMYSAPTTDIIFDIKETYGKLWWMLYDPSTSSLKRFTLTENYNHFANAYTDSISAVDLGDSFALIYQEADSSIEPYLYGRDMRLSYLRYDYNGQFINSGKISIPDPSLTFGRIYAFDAEVLNDVFYLFFSCENNRRQSLATETVIGQDQYEGLYLQNECYPIIDPYVRVSYKRLDEMLFEVDELLNPADSAFGLNSLNHLYSTYSTTGFSDAKGGPESLGFDFKPNYKTAAARIKVNADRELSQICVSVIDIRYRQPLILTGALDSFREISVPAFFDLSFTSKEDTTPLYSLDAAWNQDGFIWSVASTIDQVSNLIDIGGSPIVKDFNEPRFEMMLVPTDILKSNELSFLKRDLGSAWNSWQGVSAFKSKWKQQAIPILNVYDHYSTYDFEIYDGFSLSAIPSFESVKTIHPSHDLGLSCCVDKNMFIINQSGSKNILPKIFQIGRADNVPFTVPCEELLLASDAEHFGSSLLPGKINIIDGDLIDTIRTNHLYIDGANDTSLIVIDEYDQISTRNRSFNLKNGTRAKITIETSGITTADGIAIFIQDSYMHQFSSTYPNEILSYGGYLHLYRSFGLLRARFYHIPVASEVTIDTITIDESETTTFDINMMIVKTGSDKCELSCIIKENRYIGNAFNGNIGTLVTNDNYYEYYNGVSYRIASGHLKMIDLTSDPQRQITIYNYDGVSADTYIIYSMQIGNMVVEDTMIGSFVAEPPYHPVYRKPSTGPLQIPLVGEDQLLSRVDLNKTNIGYPIASSNNAVKSLYWNNGFAFYPEGTSAKIGDIHSLKRKEYLTVDSARSSFLHGRWISQEDNTSIKIWARASDSGREYFNINKICLSGINFSKFKIIARNSSDDPWITLKLIDTRSQGWYSVQVDENPNNTQMVLISNDEMKPVEPDEYLRFDQVLDYGVFKIAKSMDGLIAANGASYPEIGAISLFHSCWQSDLDLVSYKEFGIEIIAQPTFEGYYQMSYLDFGYADRIAQKFDQDLASGLTFNYSVSTEYNFDNAPIDFSYRNIDRSYNISYSSTDVKSYLKIKSITESTSLHNKPIWIFTDDSKLFDLTFMESSPTSSVVIDDSDRLYSIQLKLKTVK